MTKQGRASTLGSLKEPLRIATFNAENFYLLMDRPLDRPGLDALTNDEYLAMNSSIYNPNKDRGKIAEIARIILEGDFDLVGLCEVGGMETLSNFNRLYLGNGYDCRLHEENSRRGIFVGALLKKGRFPGLRASNMSKTFSRNLLRLDLGLAGGNLTVFVVHLKAQHGSDRGIEQRVAEVQKLCDLVRHRNCIIMGDFNGILIKGQHQFEFDPLLALPFRDVLEDRAIPVEERRTHYYFDRGPSHNQLDYILCSNDVKVLHAEVIEGEVPLNMSERAWLPSDHLMLRATVATSSMAVPRDYAPLPVKPTDLVDPFVIPAPSGPTLPLPAPAPGILTKLWRFVRKLWRGDY